MSTKKKAEAAKVDVRVLDYRTTEVGRQNWEVAHRMLIQDLVDLNIPAVNRVLDFYHVTILPTGTHTMALPRLALIEKRGLKVGKAGTHG